MRIEHKRRLIWFLIGFTKGLLGILFLLGFYGAMLAGIINAKFSDLFSESTVSIETQIISGIFFLVPCLLYGFANAFAFEPIMFERYQRMEKRIDQLLNRAGVSE